MRIKDIQERTIPISRNAHTSIPSGAGYKSGGDRHGYAARGQTHRPGT